MCKISGAKFLEVKGNISPPLYDMEHEVLQNNPSLKWNGGLEITEAVFLLYATALSSRNAALNLTEQPKYITLHLFGFPSLFHVSKALSNTTQSGALGCM